MRIGEINHLEVLRESDIAYVLSDGANEIFMHKKEALRSYVSGETIEVFLYVDNLGRPAATTKTPLVSLTTAHFLDVVSINYEYGVFLNFGLVKDLLLSKDDLPLGVAQWPIVGDHLFVSLKVKKEHLLAKIVSRKSISQYFTGALPIEVGEFVPATVLFLLVEGIVLFTDYGQEIFVHYNNTRKKYRMGESASVKILKLNEDGEYVGTLIGQKEDMLEPDAQTILTYLQKHTGTMRYNDRSEPEDIQQTFHMSKGAFKRAIGSLYKAGMIELLPECTRLIKKD